MGHLGLNGWGIYGLKGWGIYDLNGWGSYGKVAVFCMLKKHWSSGEYPFRSSHRPPTQSDEELLCLDLHGEAHRKLPSIFQPLAKDTDVLIPETKVITT